MNSIKEAYKMAEACNEIRLRQNEINNMTNENWEQEMSNKNDYLAQQPNPKKENNMSILNDENYQQDITETNEEKEIMEERAVTRATVTQLEGYHPDSIEVDHAKIDHLSNLLVNLVNELLPEEEEGLAGDRTYFLKGFWYSCKNRIEKKEEAFKKCAWSAQKAQREFTGDEISSQRKIDAVNRCNDVLYQLDNLKKHYEPAIRGAWDFITDQPFENSPRPQATDKTDMDDMKINELLRKAGIDN